MTHHLYSDDSGAFLMLKGVVRGEELAAAIKFWFEDDETFVIYTMARWGVGTDVMGEPSKMLYTMPNRGRGIFPATIVVTNESARYEFMHSYLGDHSESKEAA